MDTTSISLSFIIISISYYFQCANTIGYIHNRYPVFWNVDETIEPLVNVTEYDILPRNWTQCGPQCCTPNCSKWNQGVWPTIVNGHINYGGVPQNGNLTRHLQYIEKHLPQWIPDVNWNGNAVFDFEYWTTVWDYNIGSGNYHSKVYQNYSIHLASQQYPNYNDSQIYNIAKQQFETAALEWYVETLKLCKSIRPNARWGFYGMPMNIYGPCTGVGDNMQCGYSDPNGGELYRNYSDQQIPIWKASDALYPSIYLELGYSFDWNKAYINNTIIESLRCAKNGNISDILVYPYIWQKYKDTDTFLKLDDLNSSIQLPYNLGAEGLVLWGNSKNYTDYFNMYTGPTIYDIVEDVNICSQKYCSGHGRCINLTSTYCQCDVDYSGANCNQQ
eukprot:465070_1